MASSLYAVDPCPCLEARGFLDSRVIRRFLIVEYARRDAAVHLGSMYLGSKFDAGRKEEQGNGEQVLLAPKRPPSLILPPPFLLRSFSFDPFSSALPVMSAGESAVPSVSVSEVERRRKWEERGISAVGRSSEEMQAHRSFLPPSFFFCPFLPLSPSLLLQICSRALTWTRSCRLSYCRSSDFSLCSM